MQKHRFYANPSSFNGETVALGADESHHLYRVLRLESGDRVYVFDGEGREWEAEVSVAGRSAAELRTLIQLTDPVESPLELVLAQALIKGDKFDLVVQKCVELGVSRIVPLITEHCEIRRAEERLDHRLQRWRKIAIEAVKQCGRRKIPSIVDPLKFGEFVEASSGPRLMLSEKGGESMRAIAGRLGSIESLSLCIAPEGGWSQTEMEKAAASDLIFARLGPRILRTETAAIAATAVSMHLFGDM